MNIPCTFHQDYPSCSRDIMVTRAVWTNGWTNRRTDAQNIMSWWHKNIQTDNFPVNFRILIWSICSSHLRVCMCVQVYHLQANIGESYLGLYGGSAAAEGVLDELRGSNTVFSSFFFRRSSRMTLAAPESVILDSSSISRSVFTSSSISSSWSLLTSSRSSSRTFSLSLPTWFTVDDDNDEDSLDLSCGRRRRRTPGDF